MKRHKGGGEESERGRKTTVKDWKKNMEKNKKDKWCESKRKNKGKKVKD